MKTKSTLPIAVATLMFGFAAGALAADYGNSASPTSPSSYSNSSSNSPSDSSVSPTDAKAISGTVEQIDTDKNSVQIKDASGNVQTYQVNAGTQILRQGNTIELAELRKGDVITIRNASTSM